MPSKNRIKKYLPDTTYHIYNRGIDGREVFSEEEDYQKFLAILEKYLVREIVDDQSIYKNDRPYLRKRREMMSLASEMELLAICLMPDHLHMMVWQKQDWAMRKLMQRAVTYYSMYYNRKYQRSGPLFENVYRAVIVPPGEQGLLVSKYIHTNPVTRQVKRFGLVETTSGFNPEYYLYSSYANYLGKDTAGVNPEMIKIDRVQKWFDQSKWSKEDMTYPKFVEETVTNWEELLGGLMLEKL